MYLFNIIYKITKIKKEMKKKNMWHIIIGRVKGGTKKVEKNCILYHN